MLFNTQRIRSFSAILLLLITLAGCSIRGNEVYQSNNVAIDGFDPVSYFIDGEARKGNSKYQIELLGVKWNFTNEHNKVMFEQSPETYIPQYGGYCAYAMSYGLVVSSDPYAFSIIEDKLYLNYSFSVRDKWLRKTEQYIREGDQKWMNKI